MKDIQMNVLDTGELRSKSISSYATIITVNELSS